MNFSIDDYIQQDEEVIQLTYYVKKSFFFFSE